MLDESFFNRGVSARSTQTGNSLSLATAGEGAYSLEERPMKGSMQKMAVIDHCPLFSPRKK